MNLIFKNNSETALLYLFDAGYTFLEVYNYSSCRFIMFITLNKSEN